MRSPFAQTMLDNINVPRHKQPIVWSHMYPRASADATAVRKRR